MKKILAMAAAAVFMMSCSGSDDTDSTNSETDAVLVKKTIDVYDGITLTNTYTYNGTKIVKIVGSDDSETTFTYTGDLLTASKYHEFEFTQRDTFEYNSNNTLKTHIRYNDFDEATKTEFTYNQDNTISVTSFYGTHDVQDTPGGSLLVKFSNGNLISAGSDYTFTFDTKNNPYKNITGYNTLVLSDLEGGVNNILTASDTGDTTTYIYTYNGADYPLTEVTTYTEDGETYTESRQYIYE